MRRVALRLRRRCARLSMAMLLPLTTATCDPRGDMTSSATASADRSELGDVTAAEWSRLAERRIFFGHQSVGDNVMEGVARLVAADPRITLRIERSARPALVEGPALVHSAIGRNHDPASKSAAFLDILSDGRPFDVALYKLCFVDVGPHTDPDALFAEYVRTVEHAQALHPALQIVHVTMPLMTARPPHGWKALARRVLGRRPIVEVENNVKRNRYNGLLRARYAGRAPVFDLARVESTRPDGTRSFFVHATDTIFTLAPELTTDGGHLNQLGQRLAAERFLALLARL